MTRYIYRLVGIVGLWRGDGWLAFNVHLRTGIRCGVREVGSYSRHVFQKEGISTKFYARLFENWSVRLTPPPESEEYLVNYVKSGVRVLWYILPYLCRLWVASVLCSLDECQVSIIMRIKEPQGLGTILNGETVSRGCPSGSLDPKPRGNKGNVFTCTDYTA